ncbi:transposase family protein [Streptomyces sp. NPDC054802]
MGLSVDVIAELVAELGPLWHERHQARVASRPRKRAIGAGTKHRLVFVDRLPATLAHLRQGATRDVLACWFDVDRPTITRALDGSPPRWTRVDHSRPVDRSGRRLSVTTRGTAPHCSPLP